MCKRLFSSNVFLVEHASTFSASVFVLEFLFQLLVALCQVGIANGIPEPLA